ncbi:disease resistance protein Pik-2-like [Miscanthus floridulus]|uniref:disease resistance protein Pik-2-like n=1 Tax=Miscanthus floridulus TaxID=154761 RepID=UPI00345B42EA
MEVGAATGVGKSLLNCLLGQAKSAIAEDAASKQAVQRDMVFLTDEMPEMQTFLRNIAEHKRDRMLPRSRVEQHVRDLAYDVEDCLDDYAVHLKNPSGWRFAQTLLERQRIAQEMKGLRARVEDMSQRNRRYRFAALHPNSQPAAFSAERPSSTVGPDGQLDLAAAIFGIDDARRAARYMNQRVDLLQLINSEEKDLKVTAVWGTMGDIGQTSIIRAAYDNPSVQIKFPCRAWVRVMHPFNPKDFIQSLVNQFHAAAQGVEGLFAKDITEQDLAKEFRRHVSDQRCLIVLNDLSTIEEWDQIKNCFRNVHHKKGSRIIVSTTQVEVASLCAGQERRVSELKQLSADHSLYAFYDDKSAQDITYSAESVSSSALPTSEIDEDQYDAAAINMMVVEESQFTGRTREKHDIARRILEDSHDHLRVIVVWGMGGIGKTTLVTDVWQDKAVIEKFTKRAFVTVLRPFKLQGLLSSIAIQLDADSSGKKRAMDFTVDKENDYASMSVDQLTKALERLSKDRECLIVVDDIFETTEWDKMVEAFPKIGRATWTIVITTRQEDIAEHCCKELRYMYTYKLNTIGATEAHNLFIKTVFKQTVDLNKQYPELVEPAKLILKKCDGVPLAIVTIGSFLAEQETKNVEEWRKLNEHITARLEMNPKIGLIRAVLMEIYDGLPYYLEPCFLYMSIFPEDCNITRRRLVRRWAIEGYSTEARGKSSMEIADGYFEELIARSMILPTHESIVSRQKADSCKLQDLIRDMGISVSMEENFALRLEEGCNSSTHCTARHLAISSNWEGDKGEFESIVELSRIRSLTVFGKWKPFYISDKMRFLRVLDLEDTEGLGNHCLENVGKLLHLRYLSLRGCRGIFCLPDSVGKLSQLEVLDIKGTKIQVLPKTIVRLRKLRHLHAGGGFNLRGELSFSEKCMALLEVQCNACLGQFREIHGRSRRDWCTIACCAALSPIMMGMGFPDDDSVTVPRGMRNVKSLHTLRYVNLAWGNAIVEDIKCLTGLRKLGLVGLSKENSWNLCVAISKLSLLESLSLCSELDLSDCLNAIKPPPENLRSLKLRCKMTKLPEWIGRLQNLVKLTLDGTGLSTDDATMQHIGMLQNLSILRLMEYHDITIRQVHFKSGFFMSVDVLDLYYGWASEIELVHFDVATMPRLEVLRLGLGKDVTFSGLHCRHRIKEVQLRFSSTFPEYSKEKFCQEMRDRLEENWHGPVLKVE